MAINIEILNGKPLDDQSPEFQEWFNLEIQPQITFGDGNYGTEKTCSEFDEFGRALYWIFSDIKVKAEYITPFSNKHDFNKFIIYAATI